MRLWTFLYFCSPELNEFLVDQTLLWVYASVSHIRSTIAANWRWPCSLACIILVATLHWHHCIYSASHATLIAMFHPQTWRLSEDANKPSGECPVCYALRQLHIKRWLQLRCSNDTTMTKLFCDITTTYQEKKTFYVLKCRSDVAICSSQWERSISDWACIYFYLVRRTHASTDIRI